MHIVNVSCEKRWLGRERKEEGKEVRHENNRRARETVGSIILETSSNKQKTTDHAFHTRDFAQYFPC